MNDFIFGTLATDELRLTHVRRLRAGITHRSARKPLDPQPGAAVTLELTVGPEHLCDRAWVYWSNDGQEPQGAHGQTKHGQALAMQLVDVQWDTLLWGYVRRFRAEIPGQASGALVRYRLAADSIQGGETFADGGTTYAYWVADDPLPEWARRAVVYQIFVDRFAPGAGRQFARPETPAGFYGGTLRGITENLDYVADLGATVLWLTPIFPSPSHHGYDATDLFDIEPRLGSKQDLRALLDAAHNRGIRVLLDFVPNHWSSQHPTFQEAIRDRNSPYVDWYNFSQWPDEYETFFGVPGLPQINLRHAPARQHLLDAAAYWLDFGVDGYRLDYAIGPAPEFWADFRRVTRTVKPDCWTFGEVVEPSDSQLAFDGLLDGCLDFMLLEAMRQTFAFGRWDAARFADFLDRHERYFPPEFSRPSFLDNHDMNRYLWAAGGDLRRLRLAALCQFTLSGPPVVYYGTEVALSQARDVRQNGRGLPEESRLPMLWGQQQDLDLRAYYQALIELRRQTPSLTLGRRTTQFAQESLLIYRIDPPQGQAGQAVLVALNLSEEPTFAQLESGVSAMLLASEAGCELQSGHRLRLPALSGAILAIEG